MDMHQWKHVFKLDPDRAISDKDLELICESGTHAVMVGGSSGVTFDNTVDLLSRIRQYSLPCVLEISHRDAIVPGFDLYFIPIILNAQDPRWIVGEHHAAVREFGAMMHWDQIIPQGYVILNEQSQAAKVTEAQTKLDDKDVVAYARMAEHLFRFPIVYLEYSGIFGNMETVRQTANVLNKAQLFYGGGIDNLEKALQVSEVVDTIVVGNVIYDNIEQALETVKIVQTIE